MCVREGGIVCPERARGYMAGPGFQKYSVKRMYEIDLTKILSSLAVSHSWLTKYYCTGKSHEGEEICPLLLPCRSFYYTDAFQP